VETAWQCLWYRNRAVNLRRCQAGKCDCVKSGKPGFVLCCCERLCYWKVSWARKLPDIGNILHCLSVLWVDLRGFTASELLFVTNSVRFMAACCSLYCQVISSYCLIQTRDKFPLSSCNSEQQVRKGRSATRIVLYIRALLPIAVVSASRSPYRVTCKWDMFRNGKAQTLKLCTVAINSLVLSAVNCVSLGLRSTAAIII